VLDGGKVEDARAIAREARERDGGMPGVRALGFWLESRDRPQVSMNLVDIDVTGPRRAFDEVAALADARGLEVLDSEIVGLAPAAALPPGDAEHVRLRGFDPDRQILERLIEEETL